MTDSIFIEGMELVRVRRSLPESETMTKTQETHMAECDRSVMRNVFKSNICKQPMFDSDGLMTSEEGAIYRTPSGRFVTQKQVDSVFPEARNRKHA